MKRAAAQYIRMSSDAQDLSPMLQKGAIRGYAEAHALNVVATYEDDGRSGISLRGRTGMRDLIRDITATDCPFSVVLVYDVSRWGRFQDPDESAYYEYHCRMHGVNVVYVNEQFGLQPTAVSSLMKAFKRTMAAEFSRELGLKVTAAQHTAISLGFQIGRTPCIGIDRKAVSKFDGSNRPLAHGERHRKSEHVKWVLGPPHEVHLVQRIYAEYADTPINMSALARKLGEEGLSARGRPFTMQMIKHLLDCEIFVGEFTWGRRKGTARSEQRLNDDPQFIRATGILEPVVGRALWDRAQAKRARNLHVFGRGKEQLLSELRVALERNPALTATELRGNQCASVTKYREHFGSIREAMRLAGRDAAALKAEYVRRKSRTHGLSNTFRHDLAELLRAEGLAFKANGKQQCFSLGAGIRVRFKLIWRRGHRLGPRWFFQRVRTSDCTHVLLVLMEENGTANEFLLMSIDQYRALKTWFEVGGTVGEARLFSCNDLVRHLKDLPSPRG